MRTIYQLTASSALLAMVATALPMAALATEFHGYFRTGIGASRGGTDQACYQAPGASYKFRLGNECDTYFELNLAHDLRAEQKTATTDTYYRLNATWAFKTDGDRDWEATSVSQNPDDKSVTNGELTTALRELYAQANNVFAPGVSAWVGKRFYRRHDVHILDFYYIGTAGPGAGVENIDLGLGKLHLAVLRNTPSQEAADIGPVQTNIDVRLSDIATPGHGTLQPIFIYGSAGERDNKTGDKTYEAVSGWQLSLLHNQPKLLGGDNTFVLQYGRGLFGGHAESRSSMLDSFGGWGSQNVAKGDSETKKALDDSSTLRLIDQMVISPSSSLSAAFVAVFESVDFGGAKTDDDATPVKSKVQTTLGTRPVVHLTDNLDLALEYGWTNVGAGIASRDEATGKTIYQDADLHKVTVAPQISPAGFWGRPQLRLFATYATWNEDAKGHIGESVYRNDTTGFSTGAQVEAWW